jgi:leader peptidase (prepilin peptidase) / N-methyltransferase
MVNVAVFILGLFVGSFINLCIDRLPLGESIDPRATFCPSCGGRRRLRDRIPVVGYVLSGRKCSYCGIPVSPLYLVTEIAVAFIFLFFFARYNGFSVEFFARTVFVLFLILASLIDLKSKMIPDVLTVGGLATGIVLSFFRKPLFFYQDALWGAFGCGGVLFVVVFLSREFLKKEIMSLGDTVLLSMIGAYCGFRGALFSLVAGSLAGCIVGIPLMLAGKKSTKFVVPFGPFLAFGAICYMAFGDKFVSLFLRFIAGR